MKALNEIEIRKITGGLVVPEPECNFPRGLGKNRDQLADKVPDHVLERWVTKYCKIQNA